MTKDNDLSKHKMTGDSAFQKSFAPKVSVAPKLDSNKIDVKGSQQPKAVPVETKSVAPPSKDD